MTFRRRLFTTLLVTTMLVGTLAMPASAAATTRSSVTCAADYGPFGALLQFISNLLSWIDRDDSVVQESIWVRPGRDAMLSVGSARLYIPASATIEMRRGFRLTMSVQRVRNGVIVDLQPDGTTFSGRGVLLSFGSDVSSAVDEAGNPLDRAPRRYWLGDNPTFWVDHFSRYSGWF